MSALTSPRLIPNRIYEEVVTAGLEYDYPDARQIEQQVEGGTFTVVSVAEIPLIDRLQRNSNLSEADNAVLVLAAERNATAVMDEQNGRDVAATEDIPARWIAYLIVSLVKDDAMTADEARRTIDTMVDAEWYCAPNLYAQIIAKLDTLK